MAQYKNEEVILLSKNEVRDMVKSLRNLVKLDNVEGICITIHGNVDDIETKHSFSVNMGFAYDFIESFNDEELDKKGDIIRLEFKQESMCDRIGIIPIMKYPQNGIISHEK